ncbi:MAG: lipoate--protein ligase [Lentimicrobiaceae bacterium]|nr:lipoate--protein ligase [Lentimicrobiaceae bacterium]
MPTTQNNIQLQIIIGNQYNPYLNLSVESSLLDNYLPNTITLFLWKNKQTVVIGTNQNPYSECDVRSLTDEGGFLARRRTGGGAVYHDLGNLNFSFVADKEIYDVKRQMTVIQKALLNYGLETEVSGRNDITYQGRKFSGNAFAKTKHQGLHHGTILIKTDGEKLQRYLKVKPAKLHKHGVKSVASRVINLSEVADITSENIIPHLIKAFEEVYQGKAKTIDFNELCSDEVARQSQYIGSNEYLYGKWKEFNTKKNATFDWGSVEIDIDIDENKGIIKNINIASDSLDPASINLAIEILEDASIHDKPIFPKDNIIVRDIVEMIY